MNFYVGGVGNVGFGFEKLLGVFFIFEFVGIGYFDVICRGRYWECLYWGNCCRYCIIRGVVVFFCFYCLSLFLRLGREVRCMGSFWDCCLWGMFFGDFYFCLFLYKFYFCKRCFWFWGICCKGSWWWVFWCKGWGNCFCSWV